MITLEIDGHNEQTCFDKERLLKEPLILGEFFTDN